MVLFRTCWKTHLFGKTIEIQKCMFNVDRGFTGDSQLVTRSGPYAKGGLRGL